MDNNIGTELNMRKQFKENRVMIGVDPSFVKMLRELKESERKKLGITSLSDREFSRIFANRVRLRPIRIFDKNKKGVF